MIHFNSAKDALLFANWNFSLSFASHFSLLTFPPSLHTIISPMKEKKEKAEPDDNYDLPEKFHKLEKFFDDLKTDYGRRCIFEELAIETMLDIFIIATR